MDNPELKCISSNNPREISEALGRFLKKNMSEFQFPNLNNEGMRAQLWSSLFKHLENSSLDSIHSDSLACIRILSRDKTDLENLVCENWINILVERAGLYQLACQDEETLLPSAPNKDVILEALKCLCNLAFNSPVAQALCAHSCLGEGIIARLKVFKDLEHKEDIILFDMKLLFILTALRHDLKNKVKYELHGMTYLLECVNAILLDATPLNNDDVGSMLGCGMHDRGHRLLLNDIQQAIICEILKTQFNLILKSNMDTDADLEDETYIKMISILNTLLCCTSTTRDKEIELHNNVANLLTSVPESYFPDLTPAISPADSPVLPHCYYDGRNMEALYSLVRFLYYKINLTKTIAVQYESLSPILTVMLKLSRNFRVHRKYLRNLILPPLKDVSKPPEIGDTLRNQLCRLLTTPIIQVRDLTAEFLFVLCKEKVGRLVKYTGYGNAAGLLAQRGLLAGGRIGNYSSSSENSDTEEYTAAQSSLDPVVGCTRPQRQDPMAGYSEERKEYEAMKLVGLLEQLSASGVVQPARVGADGRPQPLEHLLQLRDAPPHRPQS